MVIIGEKKRCNRESNMDHPVGDKVKREEREGFKKNYRKNKCDESDTKPPARPNHHHQ